ncbi:YjbF family lipoprotein [Cypionkella aquatica]|uniref:YjbF family lipoprotein n=1 Tax=Cypionkella aquatica TaxID=1756042 RepID=UPI0024E07BCF|nr:YjbF family lipoprotein [Cypionkella aquatica]
MHRSMLTLTALLSLTACAAPLVDKVVGRVAGISAGSAAVKPAEGAPQIWFTLTGRGIKFPMSLISQRDGVNVYGSKDGSQVFLRNGMLIGTRGFGRDLMSAATPTPASLRAGIAQPRSYYDLDGADTSLRHQFSCKIERDPADPNHVSELCVADIGTIRNEFWFDSAGSISKSRQWMSQGVGYAAVERKDG